MTRPIPLDILVPTCTWGALKVTVDNCEVSEQGPFTFKDGDREVRISCPASAPWAWAWGVKTSADWAYFTTRWVRQYDGSPAEYALWAAQHWAKSSNTYTLFATCSQDPTPWYVDATLDGRGNTSEGWPFLGGSGVTGRGVHRS